MFTRTMPGLLGKVLILLLAVAATCAQARIVSPFPDGVYPMSQWRSRVGSPIYVKVTGAGSGAVYGTGLYAEESSLAAAAVHAGLLTVGQSGVLKVAIRAGLQSYGSSTANGITSVAHTASATSFRLYADDGGDNPQPPLPTSFALFRGMPGAVYLFNITADAKAGAVFGTNVFTDNSSLAAAVVHAGIMRDGVAGVVRVTIVPGQASYAGSTQNGVKSSDAGAFPGSFMVTNYAARVPLFAYPGMPANPLPDPGTLSGYSARQGAALYFSVSGSTNGNVMGSGPYTIDSSLASAAVHAGALRAGVSGVVKVTILPGQSAYPGTSANGVQSLGAASAAASFSVAAADGDLGALPKVTSPLTASLAEGQAFSYQIVTSPAATQFNATGLPDGLSINSASGLISGKPKLSGTFPINLLVANGAGTTSATLLASGVATATLSLSPSGPYNFGTVAVGQVSSITLTLSNTGTVVARVTDFSGLSAPFSFYEKCPTYLPAGGSCKLTISYAPAEDDPPAAASSEQLVISASAPVDGTPYVFSGSAKTAPSSTQPDSFSFATISGAALTTVMRASPFVVSGITRAVPISVTAGQYRINDEPLTPSPGMVRPGDVVQLQHYSAGKYATNHVTTLTIGNASATFTSRTIDRPFALGDGKITSSNLVVKPNGANQSPALDMELSFADLLATTPAADAVRGMPMYDTVSGGLYKVYVASLLPSGVLGLSQPAIFVKDISQNWGPVGSPLAAYLENVLLYSQDTNIKLNVIADFNFGLISGAEFYIGYGISDTEMLSSGRFRGFYRVP